MDSVSAEVRSFSVGEDEVQALDRAYFALLDVDVLARAVQDRDFSLRSLCTRYRQIAPALPLIISLLRRIPIYGSRIAAVLEFLGRVAAQACPIAEEPGENE